MDQTADKDNEEKSTAGAVFLIFLRLGLTSFGGPVAHLGYFHNEFVARRKWFDEKSYADLVALCQFLPGPASSQVGMAIGLTRAGFWGALAAWTAFTLPSALSVTLFAYGVMASGDLGQTAWVQGLKIAAVAVVAHALLSMMKSLTPDRARASLAVIAAIIALYVPTALGQVSAIALGGLFGLFCLKIADQNRKASVLPLKSSRKLAHISLIIFTALLISLPLIASQSDEIWLELLDKFYRSGSLVFGGGHVVLPLLQSELVPQGWLSKEHFLAGYGAAQAIPGPLFTFAAYLGAVIGGWTMAIITTIAIFLPSLLLVIGVLPYWEDLRQKNWAQSALSGVNAAVVGLLIAAFYNPVITEGIKSAEHFALVILAFLGLHIWKITPWLVVILSSIIAGILPLVQSAMP